MGCLQRKVWFASQCAISVLALGGCGAWAPKQPDEDRAPRPATTAEPACTNWNDYDEDWHRRHCDVAIRWCNGGAGGSGGSTIAIETGGAAGARWNDGTAGMAGSGTGAAGAIGTKGAAGATGSTTGAAGDAGGAGAPRDAGLAEGDGSASRDAGGSGDGGHVLADAGAARDGAGASACVVSATCPQGTSCVAGACQACAGGACTCQRDDDCSASQICDHDVGTCATPPPLCAALTTEAQCAARADCTPVYGGMSCTNTVGSPCHSGEANCTCETYSFAACVARD
jgi:hypothetical protein